MPPKGLLLEMTMVFSLTIQDLMVMQIHGIISQEDINNYIMKLFDELNTFIKIYHNAGLTDLVPADALSNFFCMN